MWVVIQMIVSNISGIDLSILPFIVIFVMAFTGSIAKDYVLLFKADFEVKYIYKIRFIRIILSTVTATVFDLLICDYVIGNFGFKGIIFVSFLSGLVGFELLIRISTLDSIIALLTQVFLHRSTDMRDYTDILREAKEKNQDIKIIIVNKDTGEVIEKKKEEKCENCSKGGK